MAEVVDTDVLIELERRGLQLGALGVIAANEPRVMAAITESELWVGVHRADSAARAARRQAWLEHVLGLVPVAPFDSAVARVHARLWAEMSARGQRIGPHDLLIAATAARHGAAVLTNNVAEFGRVPG